MSFVDTTASAAAAPAIAPPAPMHTGPTVSKICCTQKILLITSVVAAILSLVPMLRTVSSIILRSVAFLSAGATYANDMHETKTWKELSLQSLKIAAIILGIAAVAAALPMLLVASVAIDIIVQLGGFIKGCIEGNCAKSLVHLGLFVIDLFVLTGLVFGSWQLFCVASALTAALMLIIALKVGIAASESDRPWDWIDVLSYVALAGVGIGSAVMVSQVDHYELQKYRYEIKNTQKYEMNIHDRYGNYLGSVKPGETIILDRPPASHDSYLRIYYEGPVPQNVPKYCYAERIGHTVIDKHPIPVEAMPTVPVGGTALSSQELENCDDFTD